MKLITRHYGLDYWQQVGSQPARSRLSGAELVVNLSFRFHGEFSLGSFGLNGMI